MTQKIRKSEIGTVRQAVALAIALAVLGAGGAGLYFFGPPLVPRPYEIHAYFEKTEGLVKGNAVTYNSVRIGTVSAIGIPENTPVVTLQIDSNHVNKIRQGVLVAIVTPGWFDNLTVPEVQIGYPGGVLGAEKLERGSHVFGLTNWEFKLRVLVGALKEHVDKLSAIYGNWCGPSHPLDTSKAPAPIDNLDASCMRHDFCYEKKGALNCDCDAQIVSEIRADLDKKSYTWSQLLYALDIHDYFQRSPCNGDAKKKLLPSRVLHWTYDKAKTTVNTAIDWTEGRIR